MAMDNNGTLQLYTYVLGLSTGGRLGAVPSLITSPHINSEYPQCSARPFNTVINVSTDSPCRLLSPLAKFCPFVYHVSTFNDMTVKLLGHCIILLGVIGR